MTPETPVWITTARNGISWHLVADDWRRTVCGRYVGHGQGAVVRGYVLPLAEVQDRYGSQPCKHCAGVSEVVDPVKGRLRG